MLKRVAWIALLVVGCSKDKKDEAPKGADNKPVAADAASAKKPASELFVGKTVTMPEHVAKLKFGMSEADAKAAHPEVFAAKYGYEPPDFDKVETAVQIEGGRVFQTRIEIDEPFDKVKEMITAKWGPPTWETKNSIGSPEIYWDSPETNLRMKLEKHVEDAMVRFDPVMSADALLGSDPKLWGFEKTPLLGSTKDAVLAAYEAYRPQVRDDDPGSIYFSTYPIAGGQYGASVSVRVKNDKVTGYTLQVPNRLNDKLVTRLEQMFGKGKLDSMKMYTDFKGPPPAKAEIRSDEGFATTVWVGDYKK